MLIRDHETLLFIGDSITDAGRARPVGEGRGLGNGYPLFVDALLTNFYPEKRIRVLNTGVSGDTVRRLATRWQQDVLDHAPDWVSVMIGINDVWRQFDHPMDPSCHVYPDEFRATLERLVADTIPRVRGMVLMSPFFIEPRRDDAMRAQVDDYREIVAETARRHGALFADTQSYFDAILAHLPSEYLAGDRVHPGHLGHMTAARAFLDTVGFDWSRAAGGSK